MGRVETLFDKYWTERRPAPLEMTDTEIVDFLDEYVLMMRQVLANAEFPRRFVLDMEDMVTKGATLRQAVCLAAAKLKEANE